MVDSYYIVQMHWIKSPLLSVDRQHLREEQRLAQNQRYYRFLRRRQVVVHGYITHYQYRSQRESSHSLVLPKIADHQAVPH